MKIEIFENENVLPDGTIDTGVDGISPLSIAVNGSITLYPAEDEDGTGGWICVTKPRTIDGIVEAITITFDKPDEFEQFFVHKYAEIKQ